MATKTINVQCAVCPKMFTAKVADRNRGWAQCCSKACAARKREKKTGNHQRYQQLQQRREKERSKGISVYPTYESDYKE